MGRKVTTKTKSALVERKRDGRVVRRLTIYLPQDLAKRLAMHCAEHDFEMSSFVASAVSESLSRIR